jgi:hypothetical protein
MTSANLDHWIVATSLALQLELHRGEVRRSINLCRNATAHHPAACCAVALLMNSAKRENLFVAVLSRVTLCTRPR